MSDLQMLEALNRTLKRGQRFKVNVREETDHGAFIPAKPHWKLTSATYRDVLKVEVEDDGSITVVISGLCTAPTPTPL